jgi:hypothetical protein
VEEDEEEEVENAYTALQRLTKNVLRDMMSKQGGESPEIEFTFPEEEGVIL